MIKFFKQIFCKHDYSLFVYADKGIARKWFLLALRNKCSKCGKVKTNTFYPNLEEENRANA